MKRIAGNVLGKSAAALIRFITRCGGYGPAGLLALSVLIPWQDARAQADSQAPCPSGEPKMGLPIDCHVGTACQILAYVDHDPGPGFRDFGGGRQTYDGHDGTDFAIADEAAMQRGVAVRAAAAGTVVRVRDGVPDKRVRDAQQAREVSSIGCGNFVLIDHGKQWRTYYCHMRKDSVAVKPGMTVGKGGTLGMVGSSGLASYPHVHFGITHQGQVIDPFWFRNPTEDGQHGCLSLWDGPPRYIPTGLIDAGFSDRAVSIESVWDGAGTPAALTVQASALVFWAHPFGVLAGDVETLRLLSPDDKTVSETVTTIKSANRINRVSSITLSNTPDTPLRSGVWHGEYQLRRGGTLLIDSRQTIAIEEYK